MFVLAGFCDMHWLAFCIIPFLLGLALGWWLWYRFKKQIADLEGQIRGYKSTISDLEAALAECKSRRADLEGDLALTKGQMRELESEVKRIKQEKPKGNIASNVVSSIAATTVSTPPAAAPKSTTTGKVKGYAGLLNTNLQIVEGVGPKMESILQENGINNWSELASNSETSLRAVLDKYGDKYRIIDPNSWAAQASLAAAGDWNGLSKMQRELDGGKATTGNNQTEAKVDKMLVRLGLKRKWKQDDLKVVEGIGPKIEGLLHDAGIKTWRALGDASVSSIQDVLDAAGSRYKLADPGTWPKQSDMADKGLWDELDEYQDFLQGGK